MRTIKTYQATSKTTKLHALAGKDFEMLTPTKFENCTSQHTQPDIACTPGAVFTDILRGDLCKRGYASTVKAVSTKIKTATYTAYGITEEEKKNYILDRFVPINLGGTNDQSNIWPQLTGNSANKNKVESFLFEEMCAGRITVSQSQELVSTKWQKIYNLIN